MLKKDIPQGIILFKGKSKIDGQLIVVIATGIAKKSGNDKTGDMIQACIMRPDIPPLLAIEKGYDYSVCGDCKHKHFGSCYVNCAQAPTSIFKAYHRDGYVKFDKEKHLRFFKDRNIRLGSYGDPAMVDIEVWDTICSATSGFTGYTHQFNSRFIDNGLKNYCAASCDNISEYHKAKSLGWKTFRIRLDDDEPLLDTEFKCPASKESGELTTCTKCRACSGLSASTSKDPCIVIHGLEHKIKKFIIGIKKIANKKKYRKEFDYPRKKKNVKKSSIKVKKIVSKVEELV